MERKRCLNSSHSAWPNHELCRYIKKYEGVEAVHFVGPVGYSEGKTDLEQEEVGYSTSASSNDCQAPVIAVKKSEDPKITPPRVIRVS